MMKKKVLVFATALIACTAFANASLGQTTNMSDFPLAKAVPSDVFIAVMAKENPERAFLEKYWAGVWDAFQESGIMEDVWDLLTENVSDEDLDTIEAARERFGELLSKVTWDKLFKKEMLYTARMSNCLTPPSPYEGLLIGRMSGKLAETNHENLRALMQELVNTVAAQTNGGGHAPSDSDEDGSGAQHAAPPKDGILLLGECKIEGIPMTTLGVAEFPNMICVGHQKDLLVISLFNRTLLNDALRLMNGKGAADGLIQTDRFKNAIGKLPRAEDTIVFFDMGNMMRQIRAMIASVLPPPPPPPAADAPEGIAAYDDPAAPARGILTLLDDLNMFDYMITVEWTDGYRVFSESLTQLSPDAKSKPLYKVLSGGAPVEDFAKYIPEETTDFWCSSGINFAALYRYAIGFIETNIPDGKGMIASFKQMQSEEWKLDIEKDILSLLEGNIQSISADNSAVIMFKVTDEKKVNAQLDRLFKWIADMSGEEATLTISEIEISGHKGFRQVRHPMMMMMGGGMMPVVGTADGYFFFATSDGFLAKCFKTASGKHANITKSKRWRAEAMFNKKGGPVDSINFTDETKMGEELQAGIGMLSAGLGFMNMMGDSNFPPEARELLSTISPLLAKLSGVLGKLNFYQSSSSYSTSDGLTAHTYSVQNYKEPQPEEPADEGVGDMKDKSGAQEKKAAEEKATAL